MKWDEPPQGPFATACAFLLEEAAGLDSTPRLIPPPSAPKEVTSILPSGYSLRIVSKTHLTRLGETLLVYERDGDANPEPHVVFWGSGRGVKDFSDLAEGCYTAGFKELELHRDHPVAAIAFRCRADGSVSRFVVFAANGDSYEVVFRQDALLGALGMWGDPPRLLLFAARPDLDLGESCPYCLHRFTITDFRWKHDHFQRVTEQTPQHAYDPQRLVDHPLFGLDYP